MPQILSGTFYSYGLLLKKNNLKGKSKHREHLENMSAWFSAFNFHSPFNLNSNGHKFQSVTYTHPSELL